MSILGMSQTNKKKCSCFYSWYLNMCPPHVAFVDREIIRKIPEAPQGDVRSHYGDSNKQLAIHKCMTVNAKLLV